MKQPELFIDVGEKDFCLWILYEGSSYFYDSANNSISRSERTAESLHKSVMHMGTVRDLHTTQQVLSFISERSTCKNCGAVNPVRIEKGGEHYSIPLHCEMCGTKLIDA